MQGVLMQLSSRSLIDVLRSTLRRLNETRELDPGDPKVIHVKVSILESIARLEYRQPNAAA